MSLVVIWGHARCGWLVPVLSLHPGKRNGLHRVGRVPTKAFAEGTWKLCTAGAAAGAVHRWLVDRALHGEELAGQAPCLGLLPRAEWVPGIPEPLSEAGSAE